MGHLCLGGSHSCDPRAYLLHWAYNNRCGSNHRPQLPADVEIPGEPFLLYFVAVMESADILGRAAGLVAVAETSIASALYFEPS
jgi:hypothetical protein